MRTDIESLRKRNKITKKELYEGMVDKRTYNKYIANIKTAPISFLCEMTDIFGVNYQEILNGYNITLENSSYIDILRTNLANALSNFDRERIKKIFKEIETKRLYNSKYLLLWITAQTFPATITDPEIKKNFSDMQTFSQKHLEEIEQYFWEFHHDNPDFQLSVDYQILQNIGSQYSLSNPTFKKIFHYLTDSTITLETQVAAYDAFMSALMNIMQMALYEKEYLEGIEAYNVFIKIKPKFNPVLINTTYRIVCEILKKLLDFKHTGDQYSFITALNYYQPLKAINNTDAETACQDHFDSILETGEINKDKLATLTLYTERKTSH